MRSALLSFWLLLVAVVLAACQTTTTPQAAPSSPTSAATATTPPAARPSAEPAKPVASETARTLAQNCFTCHGPEGKSSGAIPSLSRLSAQRIASKLRDFKSGAEPSTVMGRHAKAYTDSEIDAVASYIASLNK
jgi:cytochrome subunit of sulfide dehydrogenase